MAGLVWVTVFDIRFSQCWCPNRFSDGLVVFPRFVSAWIMENDFIVFLGVGLLTKQRFPGLKVGALLHV
ncbi:hypothetical protein SAMN05216419_100130 [Nitrosomonas cryotolerans]|nr:hypothetical protein SAMN05216419_100130 [Nitrosomonas cryotolerans]